jgi:eukaryotic-like serine/threonine-protein kinase
MAITNDPPNHRDINRDEKESSGSTISGGSDLDSGQIGPYRLLQVLGEGGMGEVWLAEQKVPIHRTVALKVIKAGMDTKAVVARFESERQALALMDHPNIARVFDAGPTSGGRPFFVMEYVPGLPITEYCDKRRLTMNARLELFVQVCGGVQHAHQKAIIHRDLKPSNVLVMEQGDKAVPKIIDFGLAKATGQRLTDKTMYTQVGMMIGTPEYMSPEQADQSEQNIDTRTDVYSLGVILYELLAGVLPFDVQALRGAGFEAMLRVIREQEPPKPSTKIRAMGEASNASAEKRREQPGNFARRLQGELDWITLKALEKDRSLRYGSPAELASDIQRHLNNEPVLAGPPSQMYRARKFVKRHRFGVTTAAVLLVLLVGFIAAMAVQVRRVTRERDRADRISAFMTNMFKVSRPSEARGNSVTAREILDKASGEIESGLKNDPELQSHMMYTMALTYRGLGLYGRAQELLERALAIQQKVLGANDRETLRSMSQLGWLLQEQHHYAEGEKLQRQALEGQQRALGPENAQTLSTMGQLGWTLAEEGQNAEGEKLMRETEEAQTRVLGRENSSTLATVDNLSLVLERENRYAEAEKLARENLEIRSRVLGAEHPDTLFSKRNLGVALQDEGKYAEAEQLQREVLAVRLRVLGDDHPQTLLTMRDLGRTLELEGKYEEAEKVFRESLDIRLRSVGR